MKLNEIQMIELSTQKSVKIFKTYMRFNIHFRVSKDNEKIFIMYREENEIQKFKIQKFKDSEETSYVIYEYNDIKIKTFNEKVFFSNTDTYALLITK